MNNTDLQDLKRKTIETLKAIASLDSSKWVHPNGTLKVPVDELPDEVSACISSMESRATKNGTVIKVKFENPKPAIKMLQKLGVQL